MFFFWAVGEFVRSQTTELVKDTVWRLVNPMKWEEERKERGRGRGKGRNGKGKGEGRGKGRGRGGEREAEGRRAGNKQLVVK